MTTQEKHTLCGHQNCFFDPNPFPHLLIESFFSQQIELDLLNWFNSTNNWKIITTDFYEQYEFSLLDFKPPIELNGLTDDSWIDEIRGLFKKHFNVLKLSLADITAHKHTSGQSIGIHNDFIDGEESHRLVIQINSNWVKENGGFQMLFNSDKAEDVAKVIRPLSNSAMGFEISQLSHHAVSQVIDFNRFSLVYTFKAL